MEVTLSEPGWNYIQRNIMPAVTLTGEVEAVPVLPSERDSRPSTGLLYVRLTEADAEQIIDELVGLFGLLGLRPDSEPNSLGLYIESLVNVFYDGIRQAEEETLWQERSRQTA